ncbi:NAD(P)H-dependent oxidoreductase [Chitinophaga sedimenti]|uniref:NAD(P)H-dependent oxidoreductase n=1 Tax=Chitinophaga sedimenti TaxID=2033606 RepID=UPI0020053E04|nr:NAD(P)H-dependent oxidoreductase [Chitinophaga sedimenti]MCK7559020.1 NAD(P)H-dependent oxidoreductase [Chitinophaga sedimenti]
MDILEKLSWRYATKKFDPVKKMSAAQLDRILRATNLSASSYGLQPYKVIVVNDPVIREQLKAVSNNQSQITDASHLVIFARVDELADTHIDDYVKLTASTRNVETDALEGFAAMMKGQIQKMEQEKAAVWTSKQAYIALGTLLTACAVEGIDTCPMEGFNATAYDEILGLKERNLRTVVLAAVGFRAADDIYQHKKKVRKPLEDFVEIV